MVHKSEVFKSKYTKAADLTDGPVIGKISEAVLQTLRGYSGGEEQKVVVHFTKKLKPLILNLTNFDAIADIAGSDETNDWPGTEVEVFVVPDDMHGNVVRVRKPPQGVLSTKAGRAKAKAAKEPEPEPDPNDAIPF